MSFPPPPKFEKKVHHVVPVFWQDRFAADGAVGPYYFNVETRKALAPQGPGKKMAELYANIVFDEFYRPSDQLEDRLSDLEAKMVEGLDSVINTGIIDNRSRTDIAMLLATQVCRYPERFSDRMDLGKYLAIALKDFRSCPDATVLNRALHATGMLYGASISETEFQRLKQAQDNTLAQELNEILELKGYEAHFNPNLIIDAAQQVACHLLGLQWTLLYSQQPAFILSDRPIPSKIGYGFSVGLSACYGLVLSKPQVPVSEGKISGRNATQNEIDDVNTAVRERAQKWICGPGEWIHRL